MASSVPLPDFASFSRDELLERCRDQFLEIVELRTLVQVSMPEGTTEGTAEAVSVMAFVDRVRDVYDRARAYQEPCRIQVTLFGTGEVQGGNPLTQCQKMMADKNALA